jgi:3-deoxy-D-manno-octulosonate 8-phosphate phosphatase (KDO 8-P phosphatase)
MADIEPVFPRLNPEVYTAAAKISLLVLDVDGVLTDGGLYFDADGRVTKRFHVQDGLGIGILRKRGVRVAVITGQDEPAVAARMRALRIEDYYPGCRDKTTRMAELMEKYGVGPEESAFVGDDWIDLPVFGMVALPIAVANAQPEVKAAARYVTEVGGGHGAVREVTRLLLHCRGELESLAALWTEGPAL